MTQKIDTIELLIIQLNKYVAAYRKSYKLCKNVYLILQIVSGVIGCGAVLALVPAIPLYVTVAGAIPAGITILLNRTQLKEKESLYKAQHKKFKQLLSEARILSMEKDVSESGVIKSIFAKILEIEKEANYVVPFERYMKKYKLNGYWKEGIEMKPVLSYEDRPLIEIVKTDEGISVKKEKKSEKEKKREKE